MRHYASLTAILCAALFVASYASADEAADRVAIGRAIATLNESPPDALFTAVGNAASELALLRRSNPPFRIVGPSERSVSGPTVTISKEPWGEARINFPAIEPRTVDGSIVFITPDIALAEGALAYQDAATTQTTPLLFVMKREGGEWKIASLRVLAPR